MLERYEQKFPWLLDWNLLRTFIVIIEQKGVTAAANFLGVTQPTVSSALKRLEASIGHRLIERHDRRFAPTLAGLQLYEKCGKLFGIISKIPDLMTNASKQVTGHINLSMASHIFSPHLDDLLAKFNGQHPGLTWSISVVESAEVLNRIRLGQSSIGFCLLDQRETKLETTVLYRQLFGLYCGKHHRLFNRKTISVADMEGETSVSFQTDTKTGPLLGVRNLRHEAQLKHQLKGISANLPEVRRMIIAGFGIGALPVHVAERDVKAGQLRQLPSLSDLPFVDTYMVHNSHRAFNSAEKELISSITRMFDQVPIQARTYGNQHTTNTDTPV